MLQKIKVIEHTHKNLIKLLFENSGLQDEKNHFDINLIRRSIYCSRKQQYYILPKSHKESFDQNFIKLMETLGVYLLG